jgi:hypothetical protein
MVVHACNPSYAEGVDRKITVRGQAQAKSVSTYLKNKLKQKGLEVWL